MKRDLRVLAAAGVLMGSLMVSDNSFAQKSGGILKIGHFDSPASMSMLEESTVAVNRPTMGVFNNLVMFKQDEPQNTPKSIVPELATEWRWSEDGTELTFPLHQGVKWHDGKPFTAADVKCTLDLLQGKAAEKLRIDPRKSWFENMSEVSNNGDYEVTFHLKRPQPSMLAMLATGWTPIYLCHVAPAQMRQHPIGTNPSNSSNSSRIVDHVSPQCGLLETGPALPRRHRIPDHQGCIHPASLLHCGQGGRLFRRHDAAIKRCEDTAAAGDVRHDDTERQPQPSRQPQPAAFRSRRTASGDFARPRPPVVCRHHCRRTRNDRRRHAAAARGDMGHAALRDAEPARL